MKATTTGRRLTNRIEIHGSLLCVIPHADYGISGFLIRVKFDPMKIRNGEYC